MSTSPPGWAVRLREHRLRAGWSYARAASELRALDPTQPHDVQTIAEYLRNRWEPGKNLPSEHNRAQLSRLYDDPLLFDAVLERARLILDPPSVSAPTLGQLANARPRWTHRYAEEEFAMAAAHESRDHAVRAEAHTVGEQTLDQLHDDIVRLAADYTSRPPASVFGEAQQVRGLVLALLENNRRPDQMLDLYVLAGQLTGLLANASFEMGYLEAAESLARSCTSYGDLAGHGGLRAWAGGTRAIIANWQGRPAQALSHVTRALEDAPSGTATLRLRAIEARARALLQDADGTTRALRLAENERSSVRVDDLHDEVGGEFGFPEARQAFSAGSAYQPSSDQASLEDGPNAERETVKSLAIYESTAEVDRAYSSEYGARIDLAAARLLRADIDGAGEAVAPVWALPADQRLFVLTDRLSLVRRLLTRMPFQGSKAAVSLGDAIEAWSADSTAVRALPAGSLTD